jgi:SAM-dependent methyltransferase
MPFYDFKSKRPRTAIGQKIVERTTDKIFFKIRPYLKPGSHILDIGAGNGEFAERCIKNQFKYTAIEVNETYKQKLSGMGAQVIDAFVPPVPCDDNSFDYVHLSHLLEHMSTPEKALELVKEIRRVLKSNGFLCIISPDYLHSHSFFYDGDYTHSFVTTENRVIMLLVDAGYQIVFSKRFTYGKTGWIASIFSFIGKIYNNYLYWLFQAILRSKIDPTRLGRTRGIFARFIFILSQKV